MTADQAPGHCGLRSALVPAAERSDADQGHVAGGVRNVATEPFAASIVPVERCQSQPSRRRLRLDPKAKARPEANTARIAGVR